MDLKVPDKVNHLPFGREYSNMQEAQMAWEQFNEELDRLLLRYGVHGFICSGAILVKAISANRMTDGGETYEQIRTKAIARADGCPACTMYSVAQAAVTNPLQNEILTGAYAMLEEGLRAEEQRLKASKLEHMEVKGPKQ